MSEFNTARAKAQEDYDQRIAVLKGLHGKDKLSFELDAYDDLGHNSLQLLLNMYGHYDAGWIDEADFSDEAKNRILAFNRQDIVSTNAVSKSLLRRIYTIEKNIKLIKWVAISIFALNLILILK